MLNIRKFLDDVIKMMEKLKNFLNVKKHDEDKVKEFAFNIFLGIITIILFFCMRDTTVRQELLNSWFDKYILMRYDSETETKRIADELVFLDFDNTSIDALQRPDLTPRDKVADLVKIAYEKEAKIIIVDMNFSEADYSPTKLMAGDEMALTGESRDRILHDLLGTIKNDDNKNTKVLIPFITYTDRQEKRNIFSDLVDNEKIYAITSTFTANSQSDRNVRFWLPYLETNRADTKEKHLLWSIPIMTVALAIGNEKELDSIEKSILNDNSDDNKSYELNVVRNGKEEKFTFYKEQQKNQGLVRNTNSYQYNRIQYTILPPNIKASEPFGNIPAKYIGHWRNNGFKLDNERIDCKDKIVIIGRADDNCDDFHATAIGTLPGMYIHGNIIATVLSETQPHLSSMSKSFTIEILLIIIAAYVFLNLTGFKTKVIIFIMIGMCWLGSYIYFCYTNEFIVFCLAFTSLGIYNFLNNIENFFRNRLSRSSIKSFFKFRC